MLSFDQMDDAIKLIEQHLLDVMMRRDFKQANTVKQRILQLKSIRDLVEREDIIEEYNKQEQRINKQAVELEDELKQEYQTLIDSIHQQRNLTIQQLNQSCHSQQPQLYRKQPNHEVLNLQRIVNYLSNQREFKKAELYQIYSKQMDEAQMIKSQTDQKQRLEVQIRNQRIKQAQLQETMIDKSRAQEQKIRHELNKKLVEVQQKRVNMMKILNQEKVQKLAQLEKTKTRVIKVQIQQQLDELEMCQQFKKHAIFSNTYSGNNK